MKTWRYSRWDGTQSEFSLDPRRTLDAVSDLLMEGLDVEEALDWLRRQGFEMAGLDMRVMGIDELLDELRAEAESLYQKYDMDRATADLEERLRDVLDREEQAVRGEHGYESARMNEFLERRHHDSPRLSDRIEAFRDWRFEDAAAGEDFRALLDELERLRALEEFLEQRGERFRGSESADYEQAQEIRQQLESLEQMARDLAEGNLEPISAEEMADLLGSQAARSLVLLRDLDSTLRRDGYLRTGGDGLELTPRAIRRIGAQALADVYSALRKGFAGGHDVPGRGVAEARPDETRPWEFGDPLDLSITRTVLNGVRRRAAEGRGRDDLPLRLEVGDFEVQERDFTTQTTTVLLLDMSWSMSWAGRFPAAKRVAMAMDQLIRTRFPRDRFFVVGFSTRAREIGMRELPEVTWDMGDPFTNLQEGLMVADRLIHQNPSPSPQILVITDGQPTAYFRESELHVEWPMGFGGVSPHAVAETLKQVRRTTRNGITINTFMLDDAPELVGFVERMTQINSGRAFFTSPTQLGSFLMVDYLSRRKLRRG